MGRIYTPDLIKKYINLQLFNYRFELCLYSRVTLIGGDSGSGRSLLYLALMENGALDPVYYCVRHDEIIYFENQVKYDKKGESHVIVIDNADILLTHAHRFLISSDQRNQYILFGRNTRGLHISTSGYAEVEIKDDVGRLVYPYREMVDPAYW